MESDARPYRKGGHFVSSPLGVIDPLKAAAIEFASIGPHLRVHHSRTLRRRPNGHVVTAGVLGAARAPPRNADDHVAVALAGAGPAPLERAGAGQWAERRTGVNLFRSDKPGKRYYDAELLKVREAP